MTVIVATDGSALSNPNGPAGWAWVIDKQRWNSGGFPQASNQVAEMYAILMALREIPLDVPLTIQTDSRFSVNMLGDGSKPGWMHSWKPKGTRTQWIKTDGKVPANLKLVVALDKALAARKAPTKIEWVKGHSTHALNNAADKLCTRVTAAIKDGKEIPHGPGWISSNSEGITNQARKPVAGRSSMLPPPVPRVTKKPVAKPVTRRTAVAPKKRTPQEYVITSFYEEDGPLMPEKKKTSVAVLCTACDRPINPLTMECGNCSK